MDGKYLNSIRDVITRGLLYAYSKLKMETALVATLLFHGSHIVTFKVLVTAIQCCSTYLASVTSLPNKQDQIYIALRTWDLISVELIYVDITRLMVITGVYQLLIIIVLKYHLMMKVVLTCLLTKREKHSQFVNWKYGR